MTIHEEHNYKETIEILEVFYKECLDYWVTQEDSIDVAEKQALKDVEVLKHNPLVPRGKKLDPKAHNDFLRK